LVQPTKVPYFESLSDSWPFAAGRAGAGIATIGLGREDVRRQQVVERVNHF
jgi:hypothetical protein